MDVFMRGCNCLKDRCESDRSQAEANLAKNGATGERRGGISRCDSFQEGMVSKKPYDSMRTNADALAASVRADRRH